MVAQVIDMWISWLAKLVGPESTNRNSRETNTPNKCGARSGETPVKGLLHNKGGKVQVVHKRGLRGLAWKTWRDFVEGGDCHLQSKVVVTFVPLT